jgi:hypothetical protein
MNPDLRTDGAARAEPTAHAIYWPVNPVDEDERESHNFELRAIRKMLETEPQGVLVVRDNPYDLGPEALPLFLRAFVVDTCMSFFLLVDEGKPDLPVEELEQVDENLAYDVSLIQRPGVWSTCIWCTPNSARRWLAYIRHREPDGEGAWVAQFGRGIIKEGARTRNAADGVA